MKLTSTAFTAGDAIPARYTCDGEDLAPALAWSGAPQATKSFALICDDPDAPSGTFVHWVAYDIPPATHGLADGITTAMPEGTGGTMGVNDFGANGYRGPCPPSGAHHYHFKLYALDMMLSLAPGVDKQRLEKLMHGHILAHAELVGVYARGQGGR